jgi:hypothetical protein
MFKMRRRKRKFYQREPDKIGNEVLIKQRGKTKVDRERDMRIEHAVKKVVEDFPK